MMKGVTVSRWSRWKAQRNSAALAQRGGLSEFDGLGAFVLLSSDNNADLGSSRQAPIRCRARPYQIWTVWRIGTSPTSTSTKILRNIRCVYLRIIDTSSLTFLFPLSHES